MARCGSRRATAIASPESAPRVIALGADGNLWFSEHLASKMARITPKGEITEFAIPSSDSQPRAIALGADGNIWFSEFNTSKIGRITVAGQITEFAIPSATGSPTNVAVGPDRNVWYTKGAALGRVSPTGAITEFPLAPNSRGVGLTAGSDRQPPERIANRLWYADGNGNKIGYLRFR